MAKLCVSGIFNVYNALGAFGALTAIGYEPQTALKALECYHGTPGRFETPDMKGKPYSVVIDYAHTPDGLRTYLVRWPRIKREGSYAFSAAAETVTEKRPIMGEIAARYSDFCVLTSDNPRYENPDMIIEEIASGIPTGYKAFVKIENRYQAIKYAMQKCRQR